MKVPIPNKSTNRLVWARTITRAVNKQRPRAGAGLGQSQTDDGTVLYVAKHKKDLPIGTVVAWMGPQADLADATTAFERIGWEYCDTGDNDLRGKFLVGYKDSDPDYGTMRATGGEATHGDGVNDHLPHKLNHGHPVDVCVTLSNGSTADVLTYCFATDPTGTCVTVLTCVTASATGSTNAACDDLLSPVVWWCRESDSPADTAHVEDGASHGADAGENVGWHSSTDNRPPYRVVAWFRKVR